MLQKLNDQIAACRQRAADAAFKAAAISDPARKAAYLAAQDHWLSLAQAYGSTTADGAGSVSPGPGKSRRIRTADRALEANALLLQEISTSLIREGDIHALYERIVDGAISLTNADFGSMQEFHPEQNELRLLAWRGFHPASAAFWDRIGLGSVHTSCGVAFNTGKRTIVPDVEDCDFIAGSIDLDHFRLSGMRAVQSTPLVSRTGELLGMISTQWRKPGHPSEHSLHLLDVLARQAADLIERTRAEAQIVMLAREAEHRAQNLLATVQATVRLSQSDTPEGLKESIVGRIQALANVHRLFVESRWSGADLRTLALEELSPYRHESEERAHIDGEVVILKPDVAQAIAVVLHELATNSAKYGALSIAGGHVHVGWSDALDERLILRWTETGGPRVTPPTREGFGTRVMTSVISTHKGKMQFDWREGGLVCEITIPI